jgi:hypothetical protein
MWQIRLNLVSKYIEMNMIAHNSPVLAGVGAIHQKRLAVLMSAGSIMMLAENQCFLNALPTL